MQAEGESQRQRKKLKWRFEKYTIWLLHRESPGSWWRKRLDGESSGNGCVGGHGDGLISSPQRIILGFPRDGVKLCLWYRFDAFYSDF
jgi:hypothetical protein